MGGAVVQLPVARHREPDLAALRLLHGPAAITMLDHHAGLEMEFAAGRHYLLGMPLRTERAELVRSGNLNRTSRRKAPLLLEMARVRPGPPQST